MEGTITVTIPANSTSFTIPEILVLFDDDLDEDTQSFAIVAEIGADIPDEIACFHTFIGETECHGRQGAAEIKIIDNDRKHIYFVM